MFYHLLRNRVLLLQSSHLQIVLLPSRPSKSKWISRERHQDFTHFHGPGDSKWPLYPPIVGAHFTFERVTKTSPKGHVRRIATERSLFCQEHDLMDQRIIFCRVWHLSFFFPVLPLDFGGRENHENDQHETTTRWAQKPVIDWIRTSFIGLFSPQSPHFTRSIILGLLWPLLYNW